MDSQSSKLFHPWRSVGRVASAVPSFIRYLAKRNLSIAVCAVGNVFHTYNASTLRMISVSDPHPSDVTCLVADDRYVYSGCLNVIRAFHLSRQEVISYKAHTADVTLLLALGPFLISTDKSGRLIVWCIESAEIHLDLQFQTDDFGMTALCHPETYLNKILLGSRQGTMRLYNIKTSKLIFTFSPFKSGISCIESSPAIDVCAIGLVDGTIHLHNLKHDENLFTLKQFDWGAVTSLSFRSDGVSQLISGSEAGHIAAWNLDDRTLHTQITSAHSKAVAAVSMLTQEPILLTSSVDNSLKIWIFDQSDGAARLLGSLEGHSTPPRCLAFRDNEMVISAGGDGCVKMYSTTKFTKRYNLGFAATMRKKQAKKRNLDFEVLRFEGIKSISLGLSRESAWDNMIACHEKSPVVTTWNTKRHILGKHKLVPQRISMVSHWKNSLCESCCVSPCGNFAILGYSSGHLDVFNLQSGIYRGAFVDKLITEKRAHEFPIRAISMDHLSMNVFSICGSGVVKQWRFKSRKLYRKLKLTAPCAQAKLQPGGNLMAIALDDLSLVLFDTEAFRVVRTFDGAHNARITDIAFAKGGARLLSASLDCTLKVWNLLTASLVDVMLFDHPCVALAMTSNDAVLATAHSGQLGVFLWVNKELYLDHVPLKSLPFDFEPDEPQSLPGIVDLEAKSDDVIEIDETSSDEVEEMEKEFSKLICVSSKPAAQWANLLQLDVIKQRNKPKEPPKKLKSAPFFLPTVAGLETRFDMTALPGMQVSQEEQQSRILKLGKMRLQSKFAVQLKKCKSMDDFENAFNYLKGLGPSAIDVEIQGLDSDVTDIAPLISFLQMLIFRFESNFDFDLCESYFGLFLKRHRDTLWSGENDEIGEKLNIVASLRREKWNRLELLFDSSLCIVQFLKSATV